MNDTTGETEDEKLAFKWKFPSREWKHAGNQIISEWSNV